MKKTLVAILALGGMAMAASDLTYVTTSEFTMDTAFIAPSVIGMQSAVDAVLDGSSSLELNKLAHKNSTFTVTLSPMEMLNGGDIIVHEGEKLILNSIQIVSRPNGQNRPADTTITLLDTVSGTPDYSALETLPDPATACARGLITFTFADGVDISGKDSLTLSFKTTAADNGFGYTCYKAPNADVTLWGATPSFNNTWYMPIRLNVAKVKAVPEPATATLSLLALAGLAARRRRH